VPVPPLLRTLVQPQWIAAIASVGVHGALFAAGPTFSSLSQPTSTAFTPDNERQVPLIELSPEEQQNLPQFTRPRFGLNPTDDPYGLLIPDSSAPLPLPTSPQPDLPPSASRLPNPTRTPFRFNPVPLGRRSPILINPGPAPLANRPQPSTPMPGTSAPAEPAPPPTHQGPTAQDLQPPPDPAPGEDPDTLALNPDGTGGDEIPTNRLAAYLQSLTYNDAGTGKDAYVESANAWQGAVAAAGASVVSPDPTDPELLSEDAVEGAPALATLALTLPYQERVCLSPEPAPAVVGLWVLPSDTEPDETTLALTPVLLRSSGYPYLNEMALEAAATLVRPPAEPDSTAQSAETESRANPDDGPEGEPEGEPDNRSGRLETEPAAEPADRLDTDGSAAKSLPLEADSPLRPNQAYQLVVTIDYNPDDCIEPNSLAAPAPAPAPVAP